MTYRLSIDVRKSTARYWGEPLRAKEFYPCRGEMNRRHDRAAMEAFESRAGQEFRLIDDCASVIVRAR
jgi:hypothetical protein